MIIELGHKSWPTNSRVTLKLETSILYQKQLLTCVVLGHEAWPTNSFVTLKLDPQLVAHGNVGRYLVPTVTSNNVTTNVVLPDLHVVMVTVVRALQVEHAMEKNTKIKSFTSIHYTTCILKYTMLSW